MSKRFIDQEIYEEVKQENKLKQKNKCLKEQIDNLERKIVNNNIDFEEKTKSIEETSVKIIDELQEEMLKTFKTNEELINQLSFYSLFFGQSFQIAQELYKQEKINRLSREVYNLVNNFNEETYNYNMLSLEDNETLNLLTKNIYEVSNLVEPIIEQESDIENY
ncbi:2438_t:CDS:2, partial [Dentiscutata erythropus]